MRAIGGAGFQGSLIATNYDDARVSAWINEFIGDACRRRTFIPIPGSTP